MELPARPRGDELLRPGEMSALRQRLRAKGAAHDLSAVVACAFDRRTRVLPFVFADLRMAPAGVRAIGSAMVDAGFARTRIVLQQWNRRFRPSAMRLDGRVPDLLLVSSMQIHFARCQALIRDAWSIDPAHRPLIIAGGPKAIYQPADLFSADPADPAGADLAVTGEEYVLLSLLEVLLDYRAVGEGLRSAFDRARRDGALDAVPGLVYARTGSAGQAEELVDTGTQRLLGDLDELPDPLTGYLLLEPPGRQVGLAADPLPIGQVRRHTPIGSVVMTLGCKFACPYCPIPAYNQRKLRFKSAGRIAEEVGRLHKELGLRFFFGADDNFLNDRGRALEIAQALAATEVTGVRIGRRVRWATEATVHDTLAMKDDLRTLRKAGLRALWLGVEDMSGSLVSKGQTADRTLEAFALLRERGLLPMPMLMHHDDQPLVSLRKRAGLLNQVQALRGAGAVSMQILMITPSPGSKLYDQTFASGMVIDSAGSRAVEPYMLDGNYVISSRLRRPWHKQLSILAGYLWFYNPLRMLLALVRPKSGLYLADCGMQIIGMVGLAHTLRRTLPWALRLLTGKLSRATKPPASPLPLQRREAVAARR